MKKNKQHSLMIIVGIIVVIFIFKNQFPFLGFSTQSVIGSSNNLRLAANIYSPSSLQSQQVSFLNEHYDLVDVHESLLNDMSGYTGKLLVYKHSAWVVDYPYVGVCCYDSLQSSNDDWFLHNGGGRINDPNTVNDAYWMNYKSSSWRTHSINDINSDLSNYGNDGVFYDALQTEKGEMENPDEYSNNADVISSLFTLMDDFKGRINREFWVNGATYSTGHDGYPAGPLALGKQMIDRSDGFFDESLGIDWNGNWYPQDIIEVQLSMMDYAKSKGKPIIMSVLYKKNPVYKDALVLYMLGSSDKSYFSFAYGGYNYGSYETFINAQSSLISEVRSLGMPTGERQLNGNVYFRQFENGVITFNMESHTGDIDTGSNVCIPGEKKCLTSTTYGLCLGSGVWSGIKHCSSGLVCDDGNCVSDIPPPTECNVPGDVTPCCSVGGIEIVTINNNIIKGLSGMSGIEIVGYNNNVIKGQDIC